MPEIYAKVLPVQCVSGHPPPDAGSILGNCTRVRVCRSASPGTTSARASRSSARASTAARICTSASATPSTSASSAATTVRGAAGGAGPGRGPKNVLHVDIDISAPAPCVRCPAKHAPGVHAEYLKLLSCSLIQSTMPLLALDPHTHMHACPLQPT